MVCFFEVASNNNETGMPRKNFKKEMDEALCSLRSIDFSVDVDRVLRLFQACLMPRGSNINVQSEEKGLRPEKL